MAFTLVRDPITGFYNQVEIPEDIITPEDKPKEVVVEVKPTSTRPIPVHKKVK